jgi:hypothetical protein
MSITPSVFAKTRAEIIELFDWNADSLTPDQTLRIDCAVALRLALDDLQGRVVRGESIDIARMLTASEALSRLLPPAVLSQPPAEQRDDHEAAIAPLLKLYRYLHESVHTLTAENGQLRAALKAAAVPLPLDVPMTAEHVPINPPTSAIVPPGEIGTDCYTGMRPGPDDRPRRPPPVIDGAVAGAAPAKPARPAWEDWLSSGGSVGGDRWSNRNGA